MKKTLKAVALLLVLVMCFGLMGCGGEGSETASDDGYTYVPQYISIVPPGTEEDFSINNNLTMISDGLFAFPFYGHVGQKEVTEADGSIWLQDEYQYSLYTVDLEGTINKIENYKMYEREIEGHPEAEINNYINRILPTGDGNMIVIEGSNGQYYDGPKDVDMWTEEFYAKGYDQYVHYVNKTYIRVMDIQGNEISTICVNDSIEAEMGEELQYFYVNSAVYVQDTYIIATDQGIFALDKEGKVLAKNVNNGTDRYFSGIIYANDQLYVGAEEYTTENYSFKLYPTDIKTLEFGEGIKSEYIYNYTTAEGGDYDLYYTNGTNFMGTKIGGEPEVILNWLNCDVDSSNVSTGYVLADGRIVSVSSEWSDDYLSCDNNLIILTKTAKKDLPKKTEITYACQYVDYNDQKAIIKFNRVNETAKIVVKDYSVYNTEDDYNAGLTKLTTEILSGNVPDIINLSGMNVTQLAAKGLLEPLDNFMETDPEITKDSILPNVYKALEYDGHIYSTMNSFEIQTVAGAKNLVGDKNGWNMDEFKEAYAKMPQGAEILYGQTREGILYTMLQAEENKLIDWATGECHFDSPLFTDIIEFAKYFPETYEWSENEVPEETKIAEGTLMLRNSYIYAPIEYVTGLMYFGDQGTYIGLPTSNSDGHQMLNYNSSLAVSAKCKAKDVAWQFVRQQFTEEGQKNSYAIPTNKNLFEKQLKDLQTIEYQKDENGQYWLDENGEKMPIAKTWAWIGGNDNPIYSITAEQAEEIRSFITSVERISSTNYNDELTNTVINELAPYFAGDKSAEEVAKLVQSKVSIYVNEQL